MANERAARAYLTGAVGLLLSAWLLIFGCQSASQEPTGGETHFLRRCTAAESCGDELACLCGVCTAPCDEPSICSALAGAECISASAEQGCTESPAQGHCDVHCSSDADCTALSRLHRCQQGACRTGSCPQGEIEANQVLVIGDSFFAASHQITAYLEDLARGAGALASGERYRDHSSLLDNSLAFNEAGIEEQYTAASAESEVKAVIMNGGGADVLLGSCEAITPDCPVLAEAAAAATRLFNIMAQDGVLHVVYAFYPDADSGDPTLREEVDALRPLIQSACANSPVPCHWLDLRPTFAGHYDEYVQADGRNPTAAGSQAAAGAIWTTMQRYCVAQ